MESSSSRYNLRSQKRLHSVSFSEEVKQHKPKRRKIDIKQTPAQPPIEAYYRGGASFDSYPATDSERTAYWAAQEVLKQHAERDGYAVTVHDIPKKDWTENVCIKLLPTRASDKGRIQRGLFAERSFEENELILPYVGCVLTNKQFEQKYPIQGKGAEYTLNKDDVRQDYRVAGDRSAVVINETKRTHKFDIHGLTGNIKRKKGRDQVVVALDGYRKADHTLLLKGHSGKGNVYIDSEVTLSKKKYLACSSSMTPGKTYLYGLGVITNSAEPMYGKGLEANVEFWVCPKNQVYLVASKAIEEGQQILADSYDKVRYFKSFKHLKGALQQPEESI